MALSLRRGSGASRARQWIVEQVEPNEGCPPDERTEVERNPNKGGESWYERTERRIRIKGEEREAVQ